MKYSPLLACLLVFAFVLASGCSDGTLPRYQLSGTLTYNGEPVPSGVIILTPDEKKGNRGPQTYLVVEDGKYDSKKYGPIAGPHTVEIGGSHDFETTQGPDGPETVGKDLFPTHRENFDMPKKATTHDFEIKGPEVKIIR